MVVDGKCLPTIIRSCREAASRNVTVSLQDILGGHFRVLLEQSGITQDDLQVLGNLVQKNKVKSTISLGPKQRMATYLAHGVVICDQRVNRFNGQETLVHGAILGVRVKDIRCHDRS